MARGWESKAVEEQQSSTPNSTPKNGRRTAQEVQRLQDRANLELARAQVQARLKSSQNPRYLEILHSELEALNKRLAELA